MSNLYAYLRACGRGDRLRVIEILDAAVEEESISQRTADDLLNEWDVQMFPNQVPRPLREYYENIKKKGHSVLWCTAPLAISTETGPALLPEEELGRSDG